MKAGGVSSLRPIETSLPALVSRTARRGTRPIVDARIARRLRVQSIANAIVPLLLRRVVAWWGNFTGRRRRNLARRRRRNFARRRDDNLAIAPVVATALVAWTAWRGTRPIVNGRVARRLRIESIANAIVPLLLRRVIAWWRRNGAWRRGNFTGRRRRNLARRRRRNFARRRRRNLAGSGGRRLTILDLVADRLGDGGNFGTVVAVATGAGVGHIDNCRGGKSCRRHVASLERVQAKHGATRLGSGAATEIVQPLDDSGVSHWRVT
jgi:hypothetical protein